MFSCGKWILPCVVVSIASTCHGQGLSPSKWPKAERERVEKLESQVVSPVEKRSVEGKGGVVSATVSPIAVYAGVQALGLGGTAADAAATTALTQIATQLGSVVSYAGVFTMVYYDAKSHKVYSMDAGFNSYLEERDPESIPVSNLGPQFSKLVPKPTEGAQGARDACAGIHGRYRGHAQPFWPFAVFRGVRAGSLVCGARRPDLARSRVLFQIPREGFVTDSGGPAIQPPGRGHDPQFRRSVRPGRAGQDPDSCERARVALHVHRCVGARVRPDRAAGRRQSDRGRYEAVPANLERAPQGNCFRPLGVCQRSAASGRVCPVHGVEHCRGARSLSRTDLTGKTLPLSKRLHESASSSRALRAREEHGQLPQGQGCRYFGACTARDNICRGSCAALGENSWRRC